MQGTAESCWPSWTAVLTVLGIFVVLTFALFGPSLGYGFTLGDDQYLIVTNLFVRGVTLENVKYVFTHYDPELFVPLTFVSLQLNYLLAGLNAGFYHFTNLILHALNAAMVTWVAFLIIPAAETRLRSSCYAGQARRLWWAALLAGILFAIHPIQTEAVVWIAGRKDLLSTFFVLGSVIAYVQFRSLTKAGESTRLWVKRGLFVLSIVLYLLALLSKASVMTLPVVLVFLDFFDISIYRNIEINPESRRNLINTRLFTDKIPYVVLAVVFAIIAWLGKGRIVYASTAFETVIMAVKSTVFYLQKILWPTALSPAYAYHDPIVLSSPDFYIPLIILGVLTLLVLASLRWTKWIALTLVLFLLVLSPTFLNFHKGEVVYWAVDRYVYLPMVIVAIAFVWFIARVYEKFGGQRGRRFGGSILAVVVLGALAWKTFAQVKLWEADETLLEESLRHYPDSIPMRTALALLYRETGRTGEERRILERGLQYRKSVPYYTGFGSIEARAGQLDRAREYYELGRAFDPANPEPFFYLGSLEEQLGHPDEALKLYEAAIALDDSYVAAYNNAGAIFMDRGDLANAEEMFRKAVEWNPSFMEGHANLFQILSYQKRTAEGFPHLVKAYALYPENSEIALSYAYQLYERKEFEEALGVLTKLLKTDSENRTAKRLMDLVRQAN